VSMTKLGTPGATVPVPRKYSKFKVETRLARASGWDPELEAQITSAAAVYDVARRIEGSDRERLLALYLNTNNDLVGVQEVAIGGRAYSPVPVDTILRTGLLSNAAGMILVHNHPSGETEPSVEDTRITNTIVDACKLVGIKVLDHIIIGRNKEDYYSFANKGLIR